MKRGRFIVVDGIDGSGKSSQVKLLKKKLGKRAIATFDPGGTPTGQAIREILLHRRGLSPLAVFFLFLASRAALVEEVIAPALRAGKIVVCDRFDSSTFAYQVYAGRHPEFHSLMQSFVRGILKENMPDAYIILDSDLKLAHKRLVNDQTKKLTTYDKRELAYHRRVREGFKKFRPKGARVYFIDGDRTIAEVHKDVWAIVSRILK